MMSCLINSPRIIEYDQRLSCPLDQYHDRDHDDADDGGEDGADDDDSDDSSSEEEEESDQ